MKPSEAQLDIVPGAAEERGERRAPSSSASRALAAIAEAKARLRSIVRVPRCSSGGFCHFVPALPPPGSPAGPWECCDKCRRAWARPDGWEVRP